MKCWEIVAIYDIPAILAEKWRVVIFHDLRKKGSLLRAQSIRKITRKWTYLKEKMKKILHCWEFVAKYVIPAILVEKWKVLIFCDLLEKVTIVKLKDNKKRNIIKRKHEKNIVMLGICGYIQHSSHSGCNKKFKGRKMVKNWEIFDEHENEVSWLFTVNIFLNTSWHIQKTIRVLKISKNYNRLS